MCEDGVAKTTAMKQKKPPARKADGRNGLTSLP